MDLVREGPFGKDESARRAASLDTERSAIVREHETVPNEDSLAPTS